MKPSKKKVWEAFSHAVSTGEDGNLLAALSGLGDTVERAQAANQIMVKMADIRFARDLAFADVWSRIQSMLDADTGTPNERFA